MNYLVVAMMRQSVDHSLQFIMRLSNHDEVLLQEASYLYEFTRDLLPPLALVAG